MADRRPVTCRTIDVDGTPVRVRGTRPPTEGDLAILRAVRDHLAALPWCTCEHAEQFHHPDAPRPCQVRVRAGGEAGGCPCTAFAPADRPQGEPLPATCKSCSADIVWATLPDGKLIPLDAKPVVDGNLAARRDARGDLQVRYLNAGEQPAAGEHRGITHFATCKFAGQHRRRG